MSGHGRGWGHPSWEQIDPHWGCRWLAPWTHLADFNREVHGATEERFHSGFGVRTEDTLTPEDRRKEGGTCSGQRASSPPFPRSSPATARKPQASSLRPLCEAMIDKQCGLTSLT